MYDKKNPDVKESLNIVSTSPFGWNVKNDQMLQKMVVGERSGEYTVCGKISYPYSVSFWFVILAKFGRSWAWSKIMNLLEK